MCKQIASKMINKYNFNYECNKLVIKFFDIFLKITIGVKEMVDLNLHFLCISMFIKTSRQSLITLFYLFLSFIVHVWVIFNKKNQVQRYFIRLFRFKGNVQINNATKSKYFSNTSITIRNFH